MKKPNGKLKAVLIAEGLSQRELARLTNIPESHISMAIHGRFNFDESQMTKIAKVLERKPDEIFER